MGYFSKSFILDTTFVTQPYHINGEGGYNYNHWGIDLVCWNGSTTCLGWIMAHSDGLVEAVRNDCQGYEAGSYGNYVLIKHANNYRTLYAHGAPGTVEVYPGQQVKRGQAIMFMGNTGESYGGHLHFEIRRPDGYKINPEPFLAADLPGSAYLDVDGLGGPKTVARMQKVLSIDWRYVANDEPGLIVGQYSDFLKYFPSFLPEVVEISQNGKGSPTIKACQEVFKSYGFYDDNLDGLGGPKTARAFNKFLRMFGYDILESDYFTSDSMKAYQEFLNSFYI